MNSNSFPGLNAADFCAVILVYYEILVSAKPFKIIALDTSITYLMIILIINFLWYKNKYN